jgi:hypothetical protein
MIANPGEEQTRGNESIKFEVYGEKALLKGAELSLCCSGCDEQDWLKHTRTHAAHDG